MSDEKLIAEVSHDHIKYAVCRQDKKSNYVIINKKIFENEGIKKGKILDFDLASKKINTDIKILEKETDTIFKNISIVVNEPEITCTNISGFKKLNGSKVEKRDLDFILNEAKSSVIKNQEKNSILHILNSNFFLDKIKKNKMPIDIHGDRLSLHMTFISHPKNNINNITSLFGSADLKIDRIISKSFVCGIDLLNKKKETQNFFIINFDKEVSTISVFEDASMIILNTFPFGTNSIFRDINQLCSMKRKEIRNVIKELNLSVNKLQKNNYIDKKFFTESKFTKLSTNHLKEIINARINEMVNYVYNNNKNLNSMDGKIHNSYIFFEDEDIFHFLGKLFVNSINKDIVRSKVELGILNNFSALNGAAELIFKGWHREAIPISHKKKSIITSFFERFF